MVALRWFESIGPLSEAPTLTTQTMNKQIENFLNGIGTRVKWGLTKDDKKAIAAIRKALRK